MPSKPLARGWRTRSRFDWLFWKVGALLERGRITDENTAAHITETAF
jgi:hypothetical protein